MYKSSNWLEQVCTSQLTEAAVLACSAGCYTVCRLSRLTYTNTEHKEYAFLYPQV